MSRDLLHFIERHRLFAVIRADSAEGAVAAARALHEGGIRLLEIACTTPNTPAALAKLTDLRLQDALIGAGSVLDVQSARNVVAAGARFVVSPVLDEPVMDVCAEREVLMMPGAATPNEVVRATHLGAQIVKVFPAGQLGGPAFIRALREPMPQLKLCPTGGVNEENMLDYIQAGAVAVGAGGSLVDRRAMAAGDFAALTRTARRYIERLNSESSGE